MDDIAVYVAALHDYADRLQEQAREQIETLGVELSMSAAYAEIRREREVMGSLLLDLAFEDEMIPIAA